MASLDRFLMVNAGLNKPSLTFRTSVLPDLEESNFEILSWTATIQKEVTKKDVLSGLSNIAVFESLF